jgi:hypothetical protein
MARAQVDERLAAYTGRNAEGYLAPLVDAFRSNLNAALFNSAYVPPAGFYVSLEVNAMGTFFDEDSRSFMATTEGNFMPEQTVEAPTVIGDNDAVYVDGNSGTQFAFPGGFDVDNFWFACPQVRVGSWKGTEALGRFIWYDTGVTELGELTVWGVGLRHNISQYSERVQPVDLALAVTWQDAQLQNEESQEVLQGRMLSAGVQSGIALGAMYPYLGVSADWFEMDIRYDFGEGSLEPIALDYRYDVAFQMTFGFAYRLGGLAAYGEYNLASQSSVAGGLSVTFPFNSRSATP